jgi:hypothetical protein
MQNAKEPKHDFAANAAKADKYQEVIALLTAKHELKTLPGEKVTVRIFHLLFEEYGATREMWAFPAPHSGWYWDGESFFRTCDRPALLGEQLPVVAYVTKDNADLPEFLAAVVA